MYVAENMTETDMPHYRAHSLYTDTHQNRIINCQSETSNCSEHYNKAVKAAAQTHNSKLQLLPEHMYNQQDRYEASS